MSLQNIYIFPFTEQTLESSLPPLLDIFGTIFPFPSALGLITKLFKNSFLKEFPLQSLLIPILNI